ncbi:hypothetical protein [Chryseobacterium indoltheticum]|uniref:hypothetical protein n=1 Tax=Chryseobacterium indoltheticum TaxID=254 RepID=UPI003F49B23B
MKKLLFCIIFSQFANAQAPAGYYNSANGLSGASLKTALSNISYKWASRQRLQRTLDSLQNNRH